MTENRLDGFVIHTEIVKVGGQAAPESVPALPFGDGFVTLEIMLLLVLRKSVKGFRIPPITSISSFFVLQRL